MGWLDDVIERSIDRVAENRVGDKIDRMFDQVLREKIELVIAEMIEQSVKDKLSAHINAVLGNLDEIFAQFKGLDKKLKDTVKATDKQLRAKLQEVVEKIDMDVEIDPEYKKHVAAQMSSYVQALASQRPRDGYGNYKENYLVAPLRKKLLEKVEGMSLS